MRKRSVLNSYDIEFTESKLDEVKKCLNCPLDDCNMHRCPYGISSSESRRRYQRDYYHSHKEETSEEKQRLNQHKFRLNSREYYNREE